MRKILNFRVFSALFVLALMSACSTVSSEPINYPLTSIFSAIEKAMSMGIQGYSQNHREFYSRPFLIKQDEKLMREGYHERGVAKVVVLGDSRPYTIDVEVSIEQNIKPKSSEYSFDRHDKRLAKKLLNSILSTLDKSEKDKNVIDDFRPF